MLVLRVGGFSWAGRWLSGGRTGLFCGVGNLGAVASGTKAVWLGDVDAASGAEAIKIGAERFGQEANRLIAVRRG